MSHTASNNSIFRHLVLAGLENNIRRRIMKGFMCYGYVPIDCAPAREHKELAIAGSVGSSSHGRIIAKRRGTFSHDRQG